MHEMRGPGQAPGGSRIARWLSWLVWVADLRRLWAVEKAHLAVWGLLLPVAGLVAAVAEVAAPHAGNLAAWALLAGASVVVLAAWICFIAVPLVTSGMLPSGRNLADVLARRRMLRRLAHDRRRMLRRWRDSPRYAAHGHRRPHGLPPPPPAEGD